MTTSVLNVTRAVILGLAFCASANLIADTHSPSTAQSTLSAAASFEQGRTLISQNNLVEGMRLLREAADLGNPSAAFEMGSLYEAGLGVKQNYAQAKAYYEAAIRHGHRNAHFNLALMLNNELVPFSDLQQSRELMEVVAKQGDIEAQYVLATLMESTLRDVAPQLDKSIYWLGSAADKGHGKAQFMLGMHYLKGQNVARNPTTAFNLFNKAAQKGVAGAQFNLALMHEKGDGTAANLELAVRWYESAARLGNANAQQNLGIKYLLGEEIAANTPKALDLIGRAAHSGLRNSQLLLGQLYQSGYEDKVGVDLSKAEHWYLRAAKQGQPDAQYQLSLILLDKESNDHSAKFWAEQAAAAGHQDAIKLIASL